MYQVATPIWNQIAEEQPLVTKWAQIVFPLPQEEMFERLDQTANRIKHLSPLVQVAYLQMMPLLKENEAIAAFVRDNPHLADALPNVTSAGEAVQIATQEHRLDQEEQDQLLTILIK
jgi:hypothetical protein